MDGSIGFTRPPGERIYAIGDIHGRPDLLDRLLGRIRDENAGLALAPTVVFLGDYVDGGDDSRGVIQRLSRPLSNWRTHFLCGDHDQHLRDFLKDSQAWLTWRDHGGEATLRSYGVPAPQSDSPVEFIEAQAMLRWALPADHARFLAGLQPQVRIGDYWFAHSGSSPAIAADPLAYRVGRLAAAVLEHGESRIIEAQAEFQFLV